MCVKILACVITHNGIVREMVGCKNRSAGSNRRYSCANDGDKHRPEDIKLLVDKYNEGYHLVVGARKRGSQASKGRWVANSGI